jgi:ABC-2 type transport system permease protein
VIAQVTPAYWALEALRDITLDGAGLSDVAGNLLVMALFTVGFVAVAVWRFRPSDTKVGTT